MANNQLIKGAGDVLKSEGFFDVGKAVAAGLKMASQYTSPLPNRVLANQKYQQEVNNYMSNLKTDIDFTGFTAKETGVLRDYLMTERKKYTDAAQMAAKYEDTTHPDYLMYVDIMQGVNNSFTNLAAQLKSYKTNKLSYADSQMKGLVSNGTDPAITRANNLVYGFYDINGDGYVDEGFDAPFNIQDGGNLGFYMGDGSNLLYNELKDVNFKNYTAATNILQTNENIYKSGKLVSPSEKTLYKLNLQETLQDVKTLQSLIFDFRTELGGAVEGSPMNVLGKEWDRQKEAGQVDLNYMREQVTKVLLDTYMQSGINGKAEQDRKNPPEYNTTGYSRGKIVILAENTVKQNGKFLPAGEYYVYTHPSPSKPNIYKATGGSGSSGNVDAALITQAYDACGADKTKNIGDLDSRMAKCVSEKFAELSQQN